MTTRYTVEFFSRRGSLHHAEETKTLASAKRVLRDSKFGGRACAYADSKAGPFTLHVHSNLCYTLRFKQAMEVAA